MDHNFVNFYNPKIILLHKMLTDESTMRKQMNFSLEFSYCRRD